MGSADFLTIEKWYLYRSPADYDTNSEQCASTAVIQC
jgi:hypothetical protein